ncbi:hypothetical protein GS489_07565 [Rhodococcus hoagii]|nr:hypothetical protein [Prescottella equi]MBM4617997.1 hypothetical protein [Prescottella equi]
MRKTLQEEWAELRAARRTPDTKTQPYKVIGRHAIKGVMPGGTVDLTASEAEILLQSRNVEDIQKTNQRNQTAGETGHNSPDTKE